MTWVAVAPSTRSYGFDGVRTVVPKKYEVLELVDALTRVYKTDAQLVTYIVEPGAKWQMRINKAGLPFLPHPPEVGVFFCDVDNPGHMAWTPELFHKALKKYETLDVLKTTGIYHTAHGSRIVQPLVETISVDHVEAHLWRWLTSLEQAGIAVDRACRDWTHHYRLPHVRRSNCDYRSPFVELSRMQPIQLPPLGSGELMTIRKRPARASDGERVEPVRQISWTQDVPAIWKERVLTFARAVREVQSEWHTLFLALAGALLGRGVPPEQVPAICRAVSIATGRDDRTGDRELGAKTTVQRWLNKQATTGFSTLVQQWPEVAYAFDEVMATGVEARVRALAAEPPPARLCSPAEATASLENVIGNAPPGLTLISAECGLGKTQAALRVAAERSAKTHASPKAQGARAPLDSKTAISVDKNALAVQIQNDLARQGVAAKRIFGPLSVLDDDGNPACKYHDSARHIVNGGQSIQRELCEGRGLHRCDYFDGCIARKGYDGPDDARIVLGTHALIRALNAAAGSTGLLIVDEPPQLLEQQLITRKELDVVFEMLPSFDLTYTEAILPALHVVRLWLENPGLMASSSYFKLAVSKYSSKVEPAILDRAQFATGTKGDAAECAAAFHLPDPRNAAPPLRRKEIPRVRNAVDHAEKVGAASRVLNCIHHGLTAPWPVAVRVEERRRELTLVVSGARRDLAEALRREGSAVVMDANVQIHKDIYTRIMGYKPPLHHFAAGDGAPIRRTLLFCGSANRTHWLRRGQVQVEPSLVNAVRMLFQWAAEDSNARKLGIITLKPLRAALDILLRPNHPAAIKAWRESKQPKKILEELREAIGPVLRAWPGEVVLGHYGAVRGLNNMADVDCIATVADPWQNISDVERELSYLGKINERDAHVEARCRGELEQAHGRLRTVHRTRPGRALHIGRVLPGGSGWCGGQVEIRHMPNGRRGANEMSSTELRSIVDACGGLRAAARSAGCDHAYLARCQSGARPVSIAVAAALRAAIGKAGRNSLLRGDQTSN